MFLAETTHKDPMKMNFNRQSYRLILQTAMEQNFEFVDFLTVKLDGERRRQIILRHDIDFSPVLALEMARIDASYNVKATFAVLLSSPLYNPFPPANIKTINEIHALGHNIVLHHRIISGRSDEEMRQNIIKETQIMRTFFPYIQPVFIWHNLPPNDLLSNIEVPGMVNAYSGTFVERMHYISDSVLRHELDYFLTALGKHKFLHLLLHPVIWMSEKDDMVAMISYALNKIILECDKEFMLNKSWKEKFPDGIPQSILERFEELLNAS